MDPAFDLLESCKQLSQPVLCESPIILRICVISLHKRSIYMHQSAGLRYPGYLLCRSPRIRQMLKSAGAKHAIKDVISDRQISRI